MVRPSRHHVLPLLSSPPVLQARVILCGQIISMTLCGQAVSSQYLAADVNIPTTQSFATYLALAVVFLPWLAYHGQLWGAIRKRSVFARAIPLSHDILFCSWLRYLLLAAVDVEANFLYVKSYQYTTLTSVQILDCMTIPAVCPSHGPPRPICQLWSGHHPRPPLSENLYHLGQARRRGHMCWRHRVPGDG